jgi:alpha-tubulin suppressor-like RCC1 family protein
MSQRYPGGVISKTPPVTVGPDQDGEGGSAPGVWTLEQAMELQKQNLWPKPIANKTMWTWGLNEFDGNLGLGGTYTYVYDPPNSYTISTFDNKSSPTQVGGFWSQASINGYNGIGVRNTGSLWAWGNNNPGTLGQNNTYPTKIGSPLQIGALTTWVQATAKEAALAIRNDGTLWSWGQNSDGQLGRNNRVLLSSPAQVGSDTNWAFVNSSRFSTQAIRTNGTLWSWGRGGFGRLGTGNVLNRSSPTQVGALAVWSSVSSESDHCLAIRTNGTLWAWGNNTWGQLGTNNTILRSSPVQVGALTTWAKASAGSQFSLAIRTDGTIWSWGIASNGRLGQGALVDRSSPVQIGSLTDWAWVAAGDSHSVALKTGGTLWSWGSNFRGALGQNNTIYLSSPVQVGSLTSWFRISAGNNSSLALRKS